MAFGREEQAKRFRNRVKAHMKDPHEGSNQRGVPSLMNKSKQIRGWGSGLCPFREAETTFPRIRVCVCLCV